MKINRYRKVNKVLRFYSNNFGFRKPYQVLIDGTICVAALKSKINIQEQFPKYLGGDAKLLTTQCILREVEKLGPATFGAFLIMKKFGVHRCDHGKRPVPAQDCIAAMVGEKNVSRYIVATQDPQLRQKCRAIQGVPLLYLHSKTPVLESPSAFTQEAATQKTLTTFAVNDFDREKLSLLKKGDQPEERPPPRKRKKRGGPNPLSCKKKKRKVEQPDPSNSSSSSNKKKKKKKRNRSRLVKAIKKEVMATLTT